MVCIRRTLLFFMSLVSLGMVLAPSALADTPTRPNVILVMTDDQGYGDLSAHGNEMLITPNLDALHQDSVRLTNFHVCPTCSQTRASLMTGRYCSRTGVWHTVDGRSQLDPTETTIAEAFTAGGYRTGIFGKWHLGDNYPMRAQDQGFEEVLCHGGGGVTQAADYWGNDYFDDHYCHNGEWEQQEGYCTDVFFNKAAEFIDETRSTGQPFFCYIPTNAPHGPLYVDPQYSQPFIDRGVGVDGAKFYGMIVNIDENVGKLRATLEEWGIAENTIFIFCTDNGSAGGWRIRGGTWPGFNAGLKGGKNSEYEGGHRVPFFLSWPAGGLAGGRDVDTLTAHIDILPTLAEICEVPLTETKQLDGMSLVPLLNQEGDWEDRTIFVDSQRLEVPVKWRKTAVMTQQWRLINGSRLYDIQADPGQNNNIAAQHPEIMAQLTAEYDVWWDSLSEPFSRCVRIPIGDDEANPAHLFCSEWYTSGGLWNVRKMANNPFRNGYWEVEVAESGTYRVSLRLRPEHIESAWPEGTARLKIGEQEWTQPVAEGTPVVIFDGLELEAGPARIQSWLTEGSRSRGGYFAEVERIENPEGE